MMTSRTLQRYIRYTYMFFACRTERGHVGVETRATGVYYLVGTVLGNGIITALLRGFLLSFRFPSVLRCHSVPRFARTLYPTSVSGMYAWAKLDCCKIIRPCSSSKPNPKLCRAQQAGRSDMDVVFSRHPPPLDPSSYVAVSTRA